MPAAAAKLVNRVAAPVPVPAVQVHRAPSTAQASCLKVSSPGDPAEREAAETARRVVSMSEPAPVAPLARSTLRSPYVARFAGAIVQRQPISIARRDEGQPNVSSNMASEIAAAQSGGAMLPPSVRQFMEPRFRADFSRVRVHSGERAAHNSRALNASAFTVGNQIFFGRDRFRPDQAEGRELIAHELTHTIQQGGASQTPTTAQRSVNVTINQRSSPQVQRGWLPDPRTYIAEKASNIPGFTMLTVVIGYNPITNSGVDRSAGNILKGAIEMIPGGGLITQALDNHGVFAKVSAWAATQFATLKNIGSGIWQSIEDFVKGLSITDLGDLGGVWERGKRIVTGPIEQIKAFAIGLKDGIVGIIKDAILNPIAAFARSSTSGYPVLCAVMGKDPITGDKAPQDPDALMGAFMTFVGEAETWATMKKANAIPRAFGWFKNALQSVVSFVNEIPGLFVAAFKALEIVDIILIPRAFGKLAKIFGGFAGRFISWGLNAVWNLLEIVLDVVKPGALGYVKRTGAALKSILRNPVPFVGNLAAAGKAGFVQFAGNFVGHLKAGLVDWLTGSLQGVYIPTSFALSEIVKFIFSVLGLTWQNVRQKLVKVVGETAVKGMETGFDIVVTLVNQGPAAAWDKIKDQLSALKDTVIGGIIDMVVDAVVNKGIPKIVAMFIPGAGFISAIISIVDLVMTMVSKLGKIAQVGAAFVNSIAQIAAGNIGAAAKRVESVLAGLLSLAISLIAGFAGLGKVTDKVMGVVNRVRAPVDKAIDGLVSWIATTAKKLFTKLFGKEKNADDADPEKQKKVAAGLAAIDAADLEVLQDGMLDRDAAEKIAVSVKQRHPVFKSLTVVETKDRIDYCYVASPDKIKKGGRNGVYLDKLTLKRPGWIKTKQRDVRVEIMEQHRATSGQGAPQHIFNADGTFKTPRKWARRHVLSSYDMKAHYEAALIRPHKTVVKAGEALAKRGFPPASKKSTEIQPQAQALLEKFHNDVSNLWVGDSRENSRLQENVDARPEWYEERTGDLRFKTLERHLQKMSSAYGIPGPVPVTVSKEEGVDIKVTYEVVRSR